MSEAPERIWIQANHIPENVALDNWTVEPDADEAHLFVEYVRADRIEELEEKLEKAEALQEAQKLFNLYAVQVLMLGATVSRLENLESAWINLKTQAELTGGKDE